MMCLQVDTPFQRIEPTNNSKAAFCAAASNFQNHKCHQATVRTKLAEIEDRLAKCSVRDTTMSENVEIILLSFFLNIH